MTPITKIRQLFIQLFGSKNDREIKRVLPLVHKVTALEPEIQKLSDAELAAKTPYFKEILSRGASLDDILPEAYAVVREVCRRTVDMRPFDVQIMGGVFLYEGKIAEMRTGEGKTLVATLPLYLSALSGGGGHLVTVNDYLAHRDAEWMGPVYHFLGLSVGVIVHGLSDRERQQAYAADVTYGTNNEFGFDYLRDNMKFRLEDYVQRPHNFCIVDEVDSILIDEARTPLIISGAAEDTTDLYYQIERVVNKLNIGTDYVIDEKSRTAQLSDDGTTTVERLLNIDNLYDPHNMEFLHHVLTGIKAHSLFKRDVDYVIKDNQIVIVDEFTGRLMPGRRWSDGLHQAIEAKEGVKIENENQTLASITFQNYFRMYKKLAGMTGTADTEAVEFKKIYNLDVLVVPTHKNMIRLDHPDQIYKNREAKFKGAVREIKECHTRGQPVLVGTVSVEKNEELSKLLKKSGVPHQILNAKNHSREAEIITRAGHKHSVTLATNMAGRGTDIKLGPGVIELGGLHILGTDRHESRRIDNQLRGRSGRQGDPGSSRFFLSLEDDLLRIFGAGNLQNWGIYKNMGDEDALEHKLLSNAIERAQRKVEGHNFDIRKHLIEYDDVMNQQRKIIYALRRQILARENIRELIEDYIAEIADNLMFPLTQRVTDEEKDARRLSFVDEWTSVFNFRPLEELITPDLKFDELLDQTIEKYQAKKNSVGKPFEDFENYLLLQSCDHHWKEHLLAMDHLKEGIGLRGYAQRDPLIEYKREGYQYFSEMLNRVRRDVVMKIFYVQIRSQEEVEKLEEQRNRRFRRQIPVGQQKTEGGRLQPATAPELKKVGRNDPCPCGSGKKFKKCCGR